MAGHEHVYGICENKCMVETMSKSQISQALSNFVVTAQYVASISQFTKTGNTYEIEGIAEDLDVSKIISAYVVIDKNLSDQGHSEHHFIMIPCTISWNNSPQSQSTDLSFTTDMDTTGTMVRIIINHYQ